MRPAADELVAAADAALYAAKRAGKNRVVTASRRRPLEVAALVVRARAATIRPFRPRGGGSLWPVETPSMFAQVIQDHLELKRRNAELERQHAARPLQERGSVPEPPAVQDRGAGTSRGDDGRRRGSRSSRRRPRSTGPRPRTRSSRRPKRRCRHRRTSRPLSARTRRRTIGEISRARGGQEAAAPEAEARSSAPSRRRSPSRSPTRSPRKASGPASRDFDWGDCSGNEAGSATLNTGRERGYGAASLAQTLSSMRHTGQKVAEPPKSSAPAANTWRPQASRSRSSAP